MHKIINLSSTADRKSINYNNDVVNNPNSDNNSDLTIYSENIYNIHAKFHT
uniref:Uncharacterized protein n=1 Tax=Rhizophagus irregularis (strain DAOM 181602 / DAOM 197198 / MUCL 43194) TaxID=747089 RepID=U9U9L2_RHIID